MTSDTYDIQELFTDRRQYRVPFYQRAYVWSREEQWEPFWNDIRDKAEVRMSGNNPAPHFLGAIVIEPQTRRGLRRAPRGSGVPSGTGRSAAPPRSRRREREPRRGLREPHARAPTWTRRSATPGRAAA